MDTKTIQKQIDETKSELEALRADEAQLAQLHSDKATELEAMRASKSRDFASMAALEGQRAALQTMLEEQRSEIGQVEARIADLERQRVREARLEQIKETAEEISQKRAEIHVGVLALADTITAEAWRLIALRAEWKELRAGFIADARALGVDLRSTGWDQHRMDKARDFVDGLKKRGVDVDALKANPFGEEPWIQETWIDQEEQLPLAQGEMHPYADFETRVQYLVAQLYKGAVNGYLMADAPKAVAHRKANGGKA